MEELGVPFRATKDLDVKGKREIDGYSVLEIETMKTNMATKHDIVRLKNKMDINHNLLVQCNQKVFY